MGGIRGYQHWFIQKLISGDRPGHRGTGSSPSLGLITHWQETDPAGAKVALIRVTLTTFTQTEPDLAPVYAVYGNVHLSSSLCRIPSCLHSHTLHWLCFLSVFVLWVDWHSVTIITGKHHTGWTWIPAAGMAQLLAWGATCERKADCE